MPPSPRPSAGPFLRPALGVLFALLIVGACEAAAPAARVSTSEVDLPRSYKFAPEDISVEPGTTVTWTNHDNFSHSVRLLDGGEVQMMRPGESVTHAFTAPGLFRYDCSLHPNDMQGSVLVSADGE